MKLFIATIIVASTTTTMADIVSSSHQEDFINQHLKEKAMASGNAELLEHLDDFIQIREDVAARRLVEVDTEECFFGYATEHIPDYNRFRTDDDSESKGIYVWGTNAVCDDETTNIDYVPKERFDDGTINYSYCADPRGENPDWPNANIIGSATGHCFTSPFYIDSDGINDRGPCGTFGPCEWTCTEVLIINDDYLFLDYVFKPATVEEVSDGIAYAGQFPFVYDVIVRDGTGCYDTNGIHIIPGYVTGERNDYYLYDLSKLDKSKHGHGVKSGKKSKSQKSNHGR